MIIRIDWFKSDGQLDCNIYFGLCDSILKCYSVFDSYFICKIYLEWLQFQNYANVLFGCKYFKYQEMNLWIVRIVKLTPQNNDYSFWYEYCD